MAEVFGVFSYPSDDHIGEYLAFGWETGGGRWPYGREWRKLGLAEPAAPPDRMAEYASGRRPVDEAALKPSDELAVPIMLDIELDRKARREAVNVPNTGLFISNLPAGAVVEVPATVDAGGIHPESVGAIPEPWAAYIRTQMTIVELVTEAYRTGSKRTLLQALLADPVITSVSAAEKMLDEMLGLQKEFLPAFS
jgi:alpha-galactosidase